MVMEFVLEENHICRPQNVFSRALLPRRHANKETSEQQAHRLLLLPPFHSPRTKGRHWRRHGYALLHTHGYALLHTHP